MAFGRKVWQQERRRDWRDRKRHEVAELKRMWRISATPPIVIDRNRCAYMPPKGSIALGFLYRSY